jgi:hypothetical protein
MQTLKYLAGYSEETLTRVRDLMSANKLGERFF